MFQSLETNVSKGTGKVENDSKYVTVIDKET